MCVCQNTPYLIRSTIHKIYRFGPTPTEGVILYMKKKKEYPASYAWTMTDTKGGSTYRLPVSDKLKLVNKRGLFPAMIVRTYTLHDNIFARRHFNFVAIAKLYCDAALCCNGRNITGPFLRAQAYVCSAFFLHART